MTISISAQKKARKAKANTAVNSPAVVEAAADIMRLFRPTPLSAEGFIVETVRRNRILQGWDFTKADESARSLAEAALKNIGWSVRPRDSEAGPIKTADSKTCPVCGEEIFYIFTSNVDRWAYPLRFCSFECGRRAKLDRYRAGTANCAQCGNEFVPLRSDNGARDDSKFCSVACYHASIAAKRHDPRVCENPDCGKTFTPARGQKGEGQRFCSKECAKTAMASKQKAPPRPCDHCGEIFQSKQYGPQAFNQRYCSRACFLAANKREPRPCLECTSIFTPAKPERRFCSNKCAGRYRSRMLSDFRCEAV